MTPLGIILLFAILVGSAAFMFRPVLRSLSAPQSRRDKKKDYDPQSIALEIAALTSLTITLPARVEGLAPIPILLGFAIGLAILPVVGRPAITIVLLAFAITSLQPVGIVQLAMVLASFLLLKLVFLRVRDALTPGR